MEACGNVNGGGMGWIECPTWVTDDRFNITHVLYF